MKLYLYGVSWPHGLPVVWAASPDDWRKRTGCKGSPIRYAHEGWPLPAGYHRPNGNLACHAIERIPSMKSFIAALTP